MFSRAFKNTNKLLARAKGGSAKKKTRAWLDEERDGSKVLSKRFFDLFPEEQMTPRQPKKVTLSLCIGQHVRLRNDKIESVVCTTEEDGRLEFTKNYKTSAWRLVPGELKLIYDEERTDKYWIGGGMLFQYYYGPMQIVLIEGYKLDELDANVVESINEKMRGDLKHKDESRRAHAEMVCEYFDPLVVALEETEFGV